MKCDARKRDNARHRELHKERQLKKAIVYLITTKDERYGKIGMTKNPVKRLRMLQQGNPVELKIKAKVLAEDAQKFEKTLHAKLVDYCVQGEWFALTDGFWRKWNWWVA